MTTIKPLGDAEIDLIQKIADAEGWGPISFIGECYLAGYQFDDPRPVRAALRGLKRMRVGHAISLTSDQWFRVMSVVRIPEARSRRMMLREMKRRKLPTSEYVLEQAILASPTPVETVPSVIPELMAQFAAECGVVEEPHADAAAVAEPVAVTPMQVNHADYMEGK